MKLFELYAELGLDAKGFESGVKKAGKQGNTLAATLKGSVGGAATFVGDKVSATTIAVGHLMADATKAGINLAKQLGAIGLDYNAQMETYVTNFRTMLGGSAEEAEKLTGDLEAMAASTPFAMTDLADATQTLLAFGQDSSTVLDTLQTLGDISMGDANKLQSLTLAFAQASSSGKLMGQDLMQMVNAGFNPLQTIVDKTGVSMGDLKDFMSDGKPSKELRRAMREAQKEVKKLGDGASDGAKMLVQMQKDGAISAELLGEIFQIETSPGGKFYEAMLNASKTYEGMVSTLQDDSTALLGKVFKPVSEFMTNDLLPKAIGLIGEMSKAYDEGGLTAAVKAATSTISKYFAEWGPMAEEAGKGLLLSAYNGLTGDNATKEELDAFLSGIWTAGDTALDAFTTAGGKALNTIYTLMTGDTDSEKSIGEKLSTLWTTGSEAMKTFTDGAKSILADIYKGFTGGEATPENIQNTLSGLFTDGQGKLDKFLSDGKALLSGIYEGMTGNDAGGNIGVLLGETFGEGIDAIDNIKSVAGDLLGNIYTTLTGQEATAENIGKTIGGVFSAGTTGIKDVLTAANTFFSSLNEKLGDPDASIGEKIKGIFDTGLDAMINLENAAGNFMANLYGAITGDEETAQKIRDWVNDLFKTPDQIEAENKAAAGSYEALYGMTSHQTVMNRASSIFASPWEYGVSESEVSGWIDVLAKGQTHEDYAEVAAAVIAAWNSVHGEEEDRGGGRKWEEDDNEDLGKGLSLLESAAEALREAAAKAKETAQEITLTIPVYVGDTEVANAVVPIVMGQIGRKVIQARYNP